MPRARSLARLATLVLPALLVGLVGLVGLAGLAACGDDPASAVPAGAGGDHQPATGQAPAVPSTGDGTGPAVTPTFDPEKARALQAERLAEMDRVGRGLLESFRARVYDPVRDGKVRFAEGVATVRSGDAVGSFAFTCDASRPLDERVVISAGEGADALPKGSEKQVGQFASVGLSGAYRTVVHYLPPVGLVVTPSKDGLHRVVTAPPHKVDLQVSYSVDASDLVQIRGTSVRPAAEIAYYDWTFTRGRYLLEKQWLEGSDAVIDFEYDDRDTGGATLLQRATVRKGGSVFDVAFRYDRVETQ